MSYMEATKPIKVSRLSNPYSPPSFFTSPEEIAAHRKKWDKGKKLKENCEEKALRHLKIIMEDLEHNLKVGWCER